MTEAIARADERVRQLYNSRHTQHAQACCAPSPSPQCVSPASLPCFLSLYLTFYLRTSDKDKGTAVKHMLQLD